MITSHLVGFARRTYKEALRLLENCTNLLSGGNEHKFLSMWDIGDQLGFDRDLTISIAQYLKGEGLLEFRALGGIISITHYGNKEVEENLKKYVQISKQILSTDPKCLR